MDLFAGQVFLSGEFRKFPYKTISETLLLVFVTLLREMLSPFSIGDRDGQVSEEFANQVLN